LAGCSVANHNMSCSTNETDSCPGVCAKAYKLQVALYTKKGARVELNWHHFQHTAHTIEPQ